ncbi:MAG: transposase [Candidatus Brocadia sp.]|nr:transposase [Candidatus Brocadia sp.]
MTYDPKLHHRRSLRLKEYDYSRNGAYFITVRSYDKKCIFGNILIESVELTRLGKIVNDFWYEIPNHFKNVQLDTFIVMPNHIHGIIIINDDCMDAVSTSPSNMNVNNGRGGVSPRPQSEYTLPIHEINGRGKTPLKWKRTLSQIIGYYKYQTTKIINQLNKTPGNHVWQRNYYDHIIRNVDDFNKIREYIIQNPLKWALDRENPENRQ